ncbi:MAG: hypothetical protein HQL66_14180 [Magnetococcales bacterium]|nr:hypothetical protein [Magnetococcales bacterium]
MSDSDAAAKSRGLRLFLSVDIAGSTSYKGGRPSSNSLSRARVAPGSTASVAWIELYEEFYNDFPTLFARLLGEAIKVVKFVDKELPDRLRLWKILGDELIFVVRITSAADADAVLLAFHRALKDYQANIKKKHATLALKGTAWTAGFPIRNCRVELRRFANKEQQVIDYIGPDIDIGFRLTKLARPGSIVASMDLVDILLNKGIRSEFRCVFVGWERMKGVFADKPYPVHWLVYGREPHILPPWEGSIDRFAERYEQQQVRGFEDEQAVLGRIEKTREFLNRDERLELFSPYFDDAGMPEHHRTIYE